MKNKYFLLITFLAFNLLANGQQAPNAGFETWTNPKNPDGWYTFSSTGFVNLASKDITDKVEGIASAKIQSGTIGGSTTYEILSLGTASFSFGNGYTYHSVHFPFRPDTLQFAYKFASPGVDSATAYIKLSKENKTLIESELTLIKSAQWSFPFIHLTPLYPTAEIPDSLLIQFKSSKTSSNFFGIEGSTLNVDDVHFGYTTLTSIISALDNFNPGIFPNPFSTQLTFVISDNKQTTVSLYNLLGQQILQQTFTNSTTINTGQLEGGIYFYELHNDKGAVKNGKVLKH